MTAREAAEGLREAFASYAIDCAMQAIAAALVVLDAQTEREVAARDELARVRALIDKDRTGLAAGLNAVRTTLNGWDWLGGDTWGSYSYEDHTVAVLRREIASCLSEAQAHIAKALRESGDRADSAFHPEREAGALAVLAALTTCYRCQGSLHLDGPVQCEDGCDVDDEEAADDRQREYAAVIEGWALVAAGDPRLSSRATEAELLRQVEEARGIARRLRTGHLLKQQMVADNAVIEGWSK